VGRKGREQLDHRQAAREAVRREREIEQALVRSVKTDADRITVEVEGSKVILDGTVRSWVEKEEAERAAWWAPGVTAVDNRIKISD
jgi:osmotically-inducible protein OsmY